MTRMVYTYIYEMSAPSIIATRRLVVISTDISFTQLFGQISMNLIWEVTKLKQ